MPGNRSKLRICPMSSAASWKGAPLASRKLSMLQHDLRCVLHHGAIDPNLIYSSEQPSEAGPAIDCDLAMEDFLQGFGICKRDVGGRLPVVPVCAWHPYADGVRRRGTSGIFESTRLMGAHWACTRTRFRQACCRCRRQGSHAEPRHGSFPAFSRGRPGVLGVLQNPVLAGPILQWACGAGPPLVESPHILGF
jgi:hypothetical protein